MRQDLRRHHPRPCSKGFTLVELLIVVAIIALLAAVLIPRLGDSSADAKDAVLYENLQRLRHQIELFRVDHDGNVPGFAGEDAHEQMLKYTDIAGALSDTPSATHRYGPYFANGMPENPFNGGTAWKTSADPSGETPDADLTEGGQVVGWFYDPAAGVVAPNAEGTTRTGVSRITL